MRIRFTLIGVALVLGASAAAYSQESNRDAGITRAQADAILNELRQIRQLLESQAKGDSQPLAPTKRSLKIEDDYTLGPKDAPLTMVEFTDYQCPFCRQFEGATFDKIRKQYIDPGKLRFVSRNFPLENHPDALRSAEAALCAGDQGKYWAMRELLFKSALLLGEPAILGYSHDLKLNQSDFESCIQSEKHKPRILKDIQDGSALRINGTPAFLLGKTTAYGVEGVVVEGALPFAQFDARFKAAMEGPEK